MRGHLWFIRRFGLRRWLRYERERHAGATIDYAQIFTPDELALLEEHGLSMWGKRLSPEESVKNLRPWQPHVERVGKDRR